MRFFLVPRFAYSLIFKIDEVRFSESRWTSTGLNGLTCQKAVPLFFSNLRDRTIKRSPGYSHVNLFLFLSVFSLILAKNLCLTLSRSILLISTGLVLSYTEIYKKQMQQIALFMPLDTWTYWHTFLVVFNYNKEEKCREVL
jgi:hypothetical protein